MTKNKVQLQPVQVRNMFIQNQGLCDRAPFKKGLNGLNQVIEQLGYVQIDTINVIERCHHHIFYSRLPEYKKADLTNAQSKAKTVFEYWTHALAYIPTKNYKYFIPEMKRFSKSPSRWFSDVSKSEYQKVIELIRQEGPISIRDIKDDVLVEKKHAWGSRKPSKKALQLGFYKGELTVAERQSMLKKYELSDRHFQWSRDLQMPERKEVVSYHVNRALQAQAVVSVSSICYLQNSLKADVQKELLNRLSKKKLVEIEVNGLEKETFYAKPNDVERKIKIDSELIHLLSPFDPLVIQRKRLMQFFDYDHKFEAYVPAHKRVYGYFALPVLSGNQFVAVIDLKADRASQKLLIQKWTWILKKPSATLKRAIEQELDRFATFQFSP